jgi:hypothetical protein
VILGLDKVLMLVMQSFYHLSYSTSPFFLVFFFPPVLVFELRVYTLNLPHQAFYVIDFFEIGSCKLFAWAGLKLILLIFAYGVVRIIGMNRWHLASSAFYLATMQLSSLQDMGQDRSGMRRLL